MQVSIVKRFKLVYHHSHFEVAAVLLAALSALLGLHSKQRADTHTYTHTKTAAILGTENKIVDISTQCSKSTWETKPIQGRDLLGGVFILHIQSRLCPGPAGRGA